MKSPSHLEESLVSPLPTVSLNEPACDHLKGVPGIEVEQEKF
jgi:hypothetical protein